MIPTRQQGFTLPELAFTVVALAVLTFSLGGGFSYLASAKGKYETQARLERIRTAFTAAYRANAATMDEITAREFRFSATETIAHDTTAATALTQAALVRVAQFGQLSPAEVAEDSFAGRHRFFISNRLSTPMPGGYSVFYRKIAIVSGGNNGVVEAGTTMDAATGAVTVAGDDMAAVVDGFQVQRALAEETVARVDRIAKGYEKYFTNRYLANPARDIAINYFANTGTTPTRWDATGLVGSSSAGFANASAINMAQALGVAPNDLNSAYGTPIQIDNSSNTVRHPDNPTAAMSIAPYSAQVRVALPGAQTYTQSAIGAF